ncbi:MAG: hypothetical protein WDZ76_07340 [Pseudohongiellaceae bacterium]
MDNMISDKIIVINRVIARYELAPIIINENSFEFAVDILNLIDTPELYSFKIYRKELFRLNPSFQANLGPDTNIDADETLFVEDMNFDSGIDKFTSEGEALEAALNKLRMKFGENPGTATK